MDPFYTWLETNNKLGPPCPEADLVMPTIIAAGSRGITRRELGRIELDAKLLDQLLGALISAGFVVASDEEEVVLRWVGC